MVREGSFGGHGGHVIRALPDRVSRSKRSTESANVESSTCPLPASFPLVILTRRCAATSPRGRGISLLHAAAC